MDQLRCLGLTVTTRIERRKSGRRNTITSRAVHDNAALGAPNQPSKNAASMAAGTSVRRRLSMIIHRASISSGFRRRVLSGPGTRGSSQRAICQSPLVHRRLRLTSAR